MSWLRSDPFREHFAKGVLVGVLVALGLHVFGSLPALNSAKNWAWDLRLWVGSYGNRGTASNVPITIIDVDEETWRNPKWGNEPSQAPRQQLSKLIDFALDRKASNVVVDIITDEPRAEGDEAFSKALNKSLATHKNQNVFLVRTLEKPFLSRDGTTAYLRKPVVDDFEKVRPPNLHDVAPYFVASPDGVVRSWRLWQTAYNANPTQNNATIQVVPSVQLALASVRCHVDLPVSDVEVYHDFAEALTEGRCRLAGAKSQRRPATEDEMSSRIYYSYNAEWMPRDVRIVSAINILQGRENRIPVEFRGQTVIIGQSFEEARDQYRTPLGGMPGELIVSNAVTSLLGKGPLRTPTTLCDIAIEAVLIISAAWLYASYRDRRFMGAIITLALTFFACLLINELALKMHYWFDFALPLLAVYIHKVLSEMSETSAPRSRFSGRPRETCKGLDRRSRSSPL